MGRESVWEVAYTGFRLIAWP